MKLGPEDKLTLDQLADAAHRLADIGPDAAFLPRELVNELEHLGEEALRKIAEWAADQDDPWLHAKFDPNVKH